MTTWHPVLLRASGDGKGYQPMVEPTPWHVAWGQLYDKLLDRFGEDLKLSFTRSIPVLKGTVPAYTSQRTIQRQMALDIQESAAMHSNTKEVMNDVDNRLETPSSASDGDGKQECEMQARDPGFETRSASTATLHRLDISPAPSSSLTARRSDGSSKSEDVTLRILCPIAFVGAMIGRKGENIRRMRRETSSEIVIEDSVAGSDDRVVRISLCKDSPLHSSSSGGDALVAVVDSLCDIRAESLHGSVMGSEDEMHDRSPSPVSMNRDMDIRMVDGHSSLGDACEVRLLVDTSQVGSLVAKLELQSKVSWRRQAHTSSDAKGNYHSCAWVSDEMIQVTGATRQCFLCSEEDCLASELHPPRHQRSHRKRMLLAHASTGDLQYLHNSVTKTYNDYTQSMFPGAPGMSMDTVFRLLVPADRAGNIIGRGGDHIQRIRHETGARIKVYGSADDVEDRLICVYSSEDANSNYCAAQDALVRCAISLNSDEGSSRNHVVRLLAPQVSIGAVLGRKGATVMQLRQETGASIRVLAVEAPLAAAAAVAIGGGEPGGDEIIQIEGALHQCIVALRGVATLLRGWHIRRTITATPRAVTTITLAPGLLAQSLAMGAANGGLVAVPVTAAGSGAPAAYATVAHGSFPASPSVLWRQLTGTRVHLPTGQSPDGLRTLEISGPEESCQAAHTLVNQFLAVGQCPPAMPEHQSGAMVFMEEAEISPESASPGHWSPHETIDSDNAFA
eukprot:jgi/Picre1/33635/NNA_001115.t1